jgi:regulator of protease activity HflC (stomatin/prohibitin superfamily)
MAAAKADQDATQREQEAAAFKAQYLRDAEIKQAGFTAEIEDAKAKASQAGPLAQAQASQEVIAQQTLLAEREAQLTDKRLESEVRRPADAEAYKTRTLADANRDKVKAETEAEAFRQRTMAEANRDTVQFNTEAEANRQRMIATAEAEAHKVKAAADAQAMHHAADGEAYSQRTIAQAEAEAIDVRARALGDGNQALIAANKLIDVLPQLVEEAAKGIAGSNLTVLNGSQGINEVVAGVVGQGMNIYELLRRSVAAVGNQGTNGAAAKEPASLAPPSADGQG